MATSEEVTVTEEVKDQKAETESSEAKEEVKNEVKEDNVAADDQVDTPSEDKA